MPVAEFGVVAVPLETTESMTGIVGVLCAPFAYIPPLGTVLGVCRNVAVGIDRDRACGWGKWGSGNTGTGPDVSLSQVLAECLMQSGFREAESASACTDATAEIHLSDQIYSGENWNPKENEDGAGSPKIQGTTSTWR